MLRRSDEVPAPCLGKEADVVAGLDLAPDSRDAVVVPSAVAEAHERLGEERVVWLFGATRVKLTRKSGALYMRE